VAEGTARGIFNQLLISLSGMGAGDAGVHGRAPRRLGRSRIGSARS